MNFKKIKSKIMDVIRLRTLTAKSTLGFGKYYDLKVAEILKLGKHAYLRWAYYNCSNISFNDEILKELNILDSLIEKPGVSPEKHREIEDKRNKFNNGITRKITEMKRAKINRAKMHEFKIRDRKHYSKGNLQRLNHGN